MTGSGGRLMLVHAHPDDESITTGGTIARAVDSGSTVTVVTCSLGEEGEVIGDQWATLVVDRADQLGGYRIHELSRALEALGCEPPLFLGGAGRWRDSGMVDPELAVHPRAFVHADPEEAVGALVSILRRTRPHVVVSYDPPGGYGHPDHRQVHAVTTAAVRAAADPDRCRQAGPAWSVAKFYWTVTGATQLAEGLADPGPYPQTWRLPVPGELPSVADELVTTSVDVRAVLDRKLAALAAHATQLTVAESGRVYALSNNVLQPVFADEQYVLVEGTLGEVDASGRERDLFSGLDPRVLDAGGGL